MAVSRALATAGGHTGTISDSRWTAASIALQAAAEFGQFAGRATAAQALPTALSSKGSAFEVACTEVAAQPHGPFSSTF